MVWTSETIVTFFEVLTSNYGAMEVQNRVKTMQNPILVGRDHRVNHQCHIMYSLSRCPNSGPLWIPPHSAIPFAFITPLPVWEANQQYEEHIRVSVVGYFLILSRYKKKVWCRCWPHANSHTVPHVNACRVCVTASRRSTACCAGHLSCWVNVWLWSEFWGDACCKKMMVCRQSCHSSKTI